MANSSDGHTKLSAGSPPSEGDDVTMTYWSKKEASEKHLSGEIVAVTPTPDGWNAHVDTYTSERRKLVVEDGTVIVQAPRVGSRLQYRRIGFSDLAGGDTE